MRCRKVHKLISIGLDGELDDARRRAVDRHVRQCAECRRFVAPLTALADRFDLPAIPEPRAGFAQRTLARLPEEAPPANFSRALVEVGATRKTVSSPAARAGPPSRPARTSGWTWISC